MRLGLAFLSLFVSLSAGAQDGISATSPPVQEPPSELVERAYAANRSGDYATGYRLAFEAAQGGEGHGLRLLGRMVQLGQGTEANLGQAIQWFELAALQDNAAALNDLGVLSRDGIGMERDTAKAMEYFARSAAVGYELADANLGEMYQIGNGTKPDLERALAHYRHGAEHWRNPKAMFRLGQMYEKGCVVGPDAQVAANWYREAAALGYDPASARLAAATSPMVNSDGPPGAGSLPAVLEWSDTGVCGELR